MQSFIAENYNTLLQHGSLNYLPHFNKQHYNNLGLIELSQKWKKDRAIKILEAWQKAD